MIHPAPSTHRLGALALAVEPPVPGAGAILDELAPLVAPGSGPRLHVRFAEALEPLHDARFYDPVTVGRDNSFTVSRRQLDYRVDYSGDRVVVTVVPKPRHEEAVAATFTRWRDWNYLTADEVVAKIFFYNVFDHLVQASQTAVDQSWIHTGAVEKDGRAVLFTGWGGVGKTTATLKLVLEHGYRFLSDDLGVIDTDGRFYRGPKKLQVYGYNIAGEPLLERHLMRGRGPLDRSSWQRKLKRGGPTRVRRRTSAEQLLEPQRVAHEAEVSTVLLIQRGDVVAPIHREMDPGELADRSAATVMREITPFVDISNAYHSAPIDADQPHLPTPGVLAERTRTIIAKGVDGREIIEITLPRAAGPADVIREVAPHL